MVMMMIMTMTGGGAQGRDPFNQNSDRSERKKWSTSNGGPVFSKLFWLYQTDPLDRAPRLSEISYTCDPSIYDITSELLLCFGAKHQNGCPMLFGFNTENVKKVKSRPLQ